MANSKVKRYEITDIYFIEAEKVNGKYVYRYNFKNPVNVEEVPSMQKGFAEKIVEAFNTEVNGVLQPSAIKAINNLLSIWGMNFTYQSKEAPVNEAAERFAQRANAIQDDEEKKRKATVVMNQLINFFSEFNFTPSFRFANTMCFVKDPTKYVCSYFEVQDFPFKDEIKEKVKSPEWKEIIKNLTMFVPSKHINTRLELFYGEPGTGKTTKAKTLADVCIVCSSDMLPNDIMQVFEFDDGKPNFEHSDVWKAMNEGRTIILDEINMLPFETLKFLQGVTDGKESFNFKGHKVDVHPDFKIYGTMNLNDGGNCRPLPAPLVDRCADLVEFGMTAELLASAII